MIRSLVFYLKLVASILYYQPTSMKIARNAEKWGKEKKEAYAHKMVQKWSKSRLKDSGAQVTVYGRENIPKDRTILIVSNHLSNFDFAVLLAELDLDFSILAKTEILKIPFVRQWMEHFNCLFIDRNDMKQQLKVILEGIGLLKQGTSLLVFPEGTRSRDGKMSEFKAGSFKLATKGKVPILPVTLIGTADVLENNGFKIKPAKVELHIHELVETGDMEKEDLSRIHEIVQEMVQQPMKGKA